MQKVSFNHFRDYTQKYPQARFGVYYLATFYRNVGKLNFEKLCQDSLIKASRTYETNQIIKFDTYNTFDELRIGQLNNY